DRHGDGLAGLARGEGEGAAGGDVVAAGGGGAVGRGVIHGHGLRGGEGQRHVEGGVGRTAVALVDVGVTDPQPRGVVIDDGAVALAGGDVGVLGAGEVDRERLVRLDRGVADDVHGDVLARLAGGEGQGAAGGVVVAAGGGGAVGGGVVDRHRL